MTVSNGRREAGFELQQLALEFEAADQAAFRTNRILCFLVLGISTAIIIVLLLAGSDWRYMLGIWVVVQILTWGSHLLSSRRQTRQTDQLKQLSAKWMTE